jgi:hypothetical protein
MVKIPIQDPVQLESVMSRLTSKTINSTFLFNDILLQQHSLNQDSAVTCISKPVGRTERA